MSKKGTSAPSATVTVATVPAPPTSLTATAQSATSVLLGWAGSTGAVGYQVWRSTGTAGPALVATVGSAGPGSPGQQVPVPPTSYTNNGLSPQTTYRYTVRAIGASGTSADSAPCDCHDAPCHQSHAHRHDLAIVEPVEQRRPGGLHRPGVERPGNCCALRSDQPDGAEPDPPLSPEPQRGGVLRPDLQHRGELSRHGCLRGRHPVRGGDGRHHPGGAAGGRFRSYRAFATGSWPTSVVAADVDGNGQNEAVVVTGFYFDDANDYSLFVHDFNQSASEPSVTRIPTGNEYADSEAAAAGDLDGDGTDDVVVATDGGVKVFLGSPTGLTGHPGPDPDGRRGERRAGRRAHRRRAPGHARLGQGSVRRAGGPAAPARATDLRGRGRRSASHGTANPVLAAGDVTGDGHDEVVLLWRHRPPASRC